jgi:hypothetical protein
MGGPGGYGPPGGMPGGGGLGPRPTLRNPTMLLILTYGILFGGYAIGMILAIAVSPFLALIGNLIALVGAVFFIYFSIVMLLELKKVTNDESFMWWLLFIPCANYYLLWWLTPMQVTKAKQMAGLAAPARNIVLYIFLFPFALASDLNELAGR